MKFVGVTASLKSGIFFQKTWVTPVPEISIKNMTEMSKMEFFERQNQNENFAAKRPLFLS